MHWDRSLLARDVMQSRPLSVSAETRLRDVAQTLSAYHIRHLPVVDGDRLIGIVSERDVREALGLALDEGSRERLDWPCLRVLCEEVITCEPESSLLDVIQALVTHKVGALPVVQAERRLVGIVSYIDVLSALLR